MEKLVKFKFTPFILGLAVLIAGLFLKYILQVYAEYTIIKWGVFLTVAGIIFLRAIQQTVNEKLEKEQNPEPEKTVQEIEINELRDELYQIKNRGFPASFIRHFFGALAALGGISIIIGNKEYLFGSILFVVSMIINAISLRWTIKYFKRYKELKNILKDDAEYTKETKNEKNKIFIVMIILIILTIIGIIGIKIMKSILEKTL